MHKKFGVLLALFVVFAGALFAQVSVDPNDRFYAEAQAWEVKGLTHALPQLRPYPLNVVRRIIEDVVEKGITDDGTIVARYEREVNLALSEYERIFSKPYHLMLAGGGTYKVRNTRAENPETGKTDSSFSDKKHLEGEAAVEGDVAFPFTPYVTLGYHLGFWGTITDYDEVAPTYQNQLQDSVFDTTEVGPADMYTNWNFNVTGGNDWYYLTAGVSRVGYGPFLGAGLTLNDTAYHGAGIIMNVSRPRWQYASLFETIGASDNLGENLTDNKYLAFHALTFAVTPRFSLSYYENIIFGPHANFLYVLPAPYMAIQNIGGSLANLQMGLLFAYTPVDSLKLAADLFVDDVSLNDVVKLNFDTKIRIAAQVGAVFAPFQSSLSYMSLDYTIVMPYVYAHWEYTDTHGIVEGGTYNYQNYTNNGISIGASIPPDSDRVSFFARFSPVRNLQLDVTSAFVRHQNVAESFSDWERVEYMLAKRGTYRTDGSIFTHQTFSNSDGGGVGKKLDSSWHKLSFMTGDHTMLVCQAGLAAQYTFPKFLKGRLDLKLGYMFEYIRNAGVERDIYPGGDTDAVLEYDDDGAFVKGTYNGVEYSDYDALYAAALSDADQAYTDWLSQLTDKVNHYITLSVKYTY